MSTFSRRHFLQAAGAAGLTLGGAAWLGASPRLRRTFAQNARIGKIIITDSNGVRLHTYLAPEASALVTSHIIETESSLVLVDTQFVQGFAAEFRAYTDSLGKPIEKVLLSHFHPDHWLGATQFAGVPFVTTAAVAAGVQGALEGGILEQLKGALGEANVPAEPYTPEGSLRAGEETLGGVTIAYDILANAEAPEQVLVRIPQAGALIAQDLIYNNAHFYPLGDNAGWLTALEGLRALAGEGYEVMLAGHGMPTSLGEVDAAIAYVSFLEATLQSAPTAEEAVAALKAAYPTYGGNLLLTFVAQRYSAG